MKSRGKTNIESWSWRLESWMFFVSWEWLWKKESVTRRQREGMSVNYHSSCTIDWQACLLLSFIHHLLSLLFHSKEQIHSLNNMVFSCNQMPRDEEERVKPHSTLLSSRHGLSHFFLWILRELFFSRYSWSVKDSDSLLRHLTQRLLLMSSMLSFKR
jgi:hypothetical protein